MPREGPWAMPGTAWCGARPRPAVHAYMERIELQEHACARLLVQLEGGCVRASAACVLASAAQQVQRVALAGVRAGLHVFFSLSSYLECYPCVLKQHC